MAHILHTDTTYRFCSRCGLELTDPVSREVGQGSICRGKNNALYSRTIPANFPVAVAHVMSISVDTLHEDCRDLWSKKVSRFLNKVERAQKKNDTNAVVLTGNDFRDFVETCDYLLSFRHPYLNRTAVTNIVRALGYIGLAGVLEGKASTGDASVWFDENIGKVCLRGSSNKIGWRAMRQIPGVRGPRYRGDGTPFVCPPEEVEKFKAAVMNYWPMFEGEWDEIEKQCGKWIEDRPPAVEDVQIIDNSAAPTKQATLVSRTEDFMLTFVWDSNKSMYTFVNALKSLPVKDRTYDPVSKVWSFKKVHMDFVYEHCKLLYGEENVEAIVTTFLTPENIYNRKKNNGKRYYAKRGRWHRY